MNVEILRNLLGQLIVAVLFAGASMKLIHVAGSRGVEPVLYLLAVFTAVLWVLVSGRWWWVVMPLSVAFGGTIYLDFKVYPHEIALLLCMLALFPVLALRRVHFPKRVRLPFGVYGLIVLMGVNWSVSLYAVELSGVGGPGSLSRTYLHGVWPLIFGILFYRYGQMDARFLVRLLYVVLIVRAALGAVVFAFEDLFDLPKIGFALSGAVLGLHDFRVIGIPLLILAFSFAAVSQGFAGKFTHWCILLLALACIVAGGGRVTFGMMLVLPLVWAMVRRQFGFITFACMAGILMVWMFNRYPETIYVLPDKGQRAVSVLLAESSTTRVDWRHRNMLSDQWHKRLSELGLIRWTQSPLTIVFGNRVEPYDAGYDAYSATFENRAEVAARLGVYESGLWTVLATQGVLGFILYIGLFWFLLKDPFLIVRADGIVSPVHALSFLAVAMTVLWALFSWIAGGFPSHELMMAFFAKAACEDSRFMSKERPT